MAAKLRQMRPNALEPPLPFLASPARAFGASVAASPMIDGVRESASISPASRGHQPIAAQHRESSPLAREKWAKTREECRDAREDTPLARADGPLRRAFSPNARLNPAFLRTAPPLAQPPQRKIHDCSLPAAIRAFRTHCRQSRRADGPKEWMRIERRDSRGVIY